ncbi:probable LRR receptor-like serine/threonine-protein kinase IRK [Andrographis paniculata]|uniref:probable LRR receptor-like serine/threonine-protein kinase IRK n=1 Tax=Andrographis paniculata TaxID=175694 RepID=UPI0021E7CC7D|nr:probable LRR receptor-like serine/threonine-protein kinase IRK [Andrographis paniculata]
MSSAVTFCICFLTSLFLFAAESVSASLNDDVLGLILFKADVQDPDGKLASWNEDSDSPCNNWAGVSCDPSSNRVSGVVLDGYGLSGKLGRGILQLKFLQTLSLSRNNFSGDATVGFAQLSDLRVLDLSENAFSGSIGNDFLTQCGNLRSLSLSKNTFSGSIPKSLSSCSSLASLNLSGNQFSGRLPPQIWSLSALGSLDLSYNLLEGEIPAGIEGASSLGEIILRNNRLSGEIPDGIGNCLGLRVIDFSLNSFSREIPSSLQKLSLCSDLILHGNAFTGNIPDWIGELRSLETLDLSANMFSGEIPTSLSKLQQLKAVNLSTNSLTGSPPETMINCTNLITIDFSHNALTGNLRSWMFDLGLQRVLLSDNRLSGSTGDAFASSTENSRGRLLVLDVSKNNLSGTIPIALRNFYSLQVLNMAGNLLHGSISSELGSMASLVELRLENNSLGGDIPASIGDCAALVSLSVARNELTGSIPGSIAKLTNLQTADFSFNQLRGTLPKQLENLVKLRVFNISHNQLHGELPLSVFFNTIDPSSVSANPSLCGAAVNRSCPGVVPKPIVLDPNATDAATTGSTTPGFTHGRKKILSVSALIAIGAAAAIVVGVIAVTVVNLRVRGATSQSTVALNFYPAGDDLSLSTSSDTDSGKLVVFSDNLDFPMGTCALLNEDCKLGRGGFGAVYRTTLEDGRSIAVKKLTVSSLVKSEKDFEREVEKLGTVRHVNVVALHGYYWTPSVQLLVYEFVAGRNLDTYLHEETERGTLTWNERFDIIVGIAKGLSHLHRMNIVHYNLKSSNILIDDGAGEAKVADYGLARLLPMLDRYVLGSKIQSALGYMAPEFGCENSSITEKCDVYGFGILVMEIVTGKRPVEYLEDDVVVLSDMVRRALDDGCIEECVDGRLRRFPSEEAVPVMKLGLICTSRAPSNRPELGEVVSILEMIRCLGNG